ncbi:MAG TPA: hypothetical protein H9865_08130 [Candidatus Fournierella pullicola]|uniref:Uncharacterized protein n=1 Tax=Candidatus Allofournierella pullicola TaxID=2838596 RepID=A0A9D1V4Q8_9FIRM|nr:hypothetical protein [Candidatus Fournierella pullicola]
MKPSLWISLFLTGVLLAACTRQNSPLVPDAPSSPPAAAAQTAEPQASGGLTLLGGWNGKSSGSSDGYYYLARQDGGDFVLHFVDYATLEDAAVCSAGCTHTDEGCTALFRWDGCDIRVYAAQDRLFVVYCGEAKEQTGKARVISCGRDGSGQRELARFGASDFIDSAPAWDGQRLYLLVSSFNEGKAERRLVSLDAATGEQKEQTGLPPLDTAVEGVFGRQLVLRFGEGAQAGWGLRDVDAGAWQELVRGEEEGVFGHYLIDPQGHAVKQTLATTGEFGDHPLEVFAGAEGNCLVAREYSVSQVEIPGPEGETEMVDEERYTFALLPKEDFWADRPNYIR